MPSTVSPCAAWKCLTAAAVCGPNTPSADTPTALCTEVTVAALPALALVAVAVHRAQDGLLPQLDRREIARLEAGHESHCLGLGDADAALDLRVHAGTRSGAAAVAGALQRVPPKLGIRQITDVGGHAHSLCSGAYEVS